MPQYIEGGFMFFSKIHDPHLHISDRILWLRSVELDVNVDEDSQEVSVQSVSHQILKMTLNQNAQPSATCLQPAMGTGDAVG